MAIQSYSLCETRTITDSNHSTHLYSVLHADRILKEHDFVYLISGGWEIYQDHIKYKADPGDVFLLHAGIRHYSRLPCVPGTQAIYIHFSSSPKDSYHLTKELPDTSGIADAYTQNIVTLPTIIHCKNNPRIKSLFSDIAYTKITGEYGASVKANALLTLLLLELHNQAQTSDSPQKKLVPDIIKLFQDNPSHYYTLQELSKLFFISGMTINRHFMKTYGKTAHAFQRDFKLKAVSQYLIQYPDSTLHMVAQNHGFYDEFHLSKAFKKKYGIAPDLYRRQYQAQENKSFI